MKSLQLSPSDQQKLKDGYGQGIGQRYLPWLKITDFSSKGLTSVKRGLKIDRNYILFSQLEYYILRILEFTANVIDIQEQFPLLPLSSTITSSKNLGFKHPQNPKTRYPNVMTSDFKVTFKDKTRIYCVKPVSELERKRVLEKISIEKNYWQEKGIEEFYIITEENIDLTLAKNLDILSHFYYHEDLGSIGFNQKDFRNLVECFLEQFKKNTKNITTFLNDFEQYYFLDNGEAFKLYYYLLAHQIIKRDLSQPLGLG